MQARHGVIELDCSVFRDDNLRQVIDNLSKGSHDKTLYDRLLLAVIKKNFSCVFAVSLLRH